MLLKWLQRQRTPWCRVCHEGGEKLTSGSWGNPLPRHVMVWDIAGAWKWSWSSYHPWDSISLPRSSLGSQLTERTENTSINFHTHSLPSAVTESPGSAVGNIGLWGCSLKHTKHSPGPTRTVIIRAFTLYHCLWSIVMNWICPLKIHMLKTYPPISQNVIIWR